MSPRAKFVVCSAVFLVVVGVSVFGVSEPAESKEKAPTGPALYHRDCGHLWNRLHTALFLRRGPDGRSYGEDRLEPLLWADSNHLLHGASAERAVAVLNEFLRDKGESLIDDPVKRAVLQRDLWLISNWLTARPDTEARKRLAVLLAQVIRRLALTPEQIGKLPNNYAAATASKEFATRFDADKPQRSYLPSRLFDPDGPWVCIGRTDGPTAPFHLDERGTNRFTNSVFLIFLKLPGGRKATVDFLKRLAAFDQPLLLPNRDDKSRQLFAFIPNSALPQWPKGTEVALVRRALLIDSARRVVASPLTESEQGRVMRTATPALTAETLQKAADGRTRMASEWQTFAEFRLKRSRLFAGEAGGLYDASDERDFKTGFNSHVWDKFGDPPSTAAPPETFPQHSRRVSNRASCASCHNFPGVYSFHSLPGFAFGSMTVPRNDNGEEVKPSLAAVSVSRVERSAVEWKKGQKGWKVLRELLPE